MSYDLMSQQLLTVFYQNNFEQFWAQGEQLKERHKLRSNPNLNNMNYAVPNDYNLNLIINYPGYKTEKKYGRLNYDYRVDLNDIPISHVNIIIDLYNKALQLPANSTVLYDLLIDLAINGDEYNRNVHLLLNDFRFNFPNNNLINYVMDVHARLHKNYQLNGNVQWNYSLDELSHLIMWIVLQEDINYPMTRTRRNGQPFAGRRMSFYRYLEAVYCAQNPNGGHSLEEVIDRALQHYEPALWNNTNINYQPIIDLAQRLQLI